MYTPSATVCIHVPDEETKEELKARVKLL